MKPRSHTLVISLYNELDRNILVSQLYSIIVPSVPDLTVDSRFQHHLKTPKLHPLSQVGLLRQQIPGTRALGFPSLLGNDLERTTVDARGLGSVERLVSKSTPLEFPHSANLHIMIGHDHVDSLDSTQGLIFQSQLSD